MTKAHRFISLLIILIAFLPVIYKTGQTPLNSYDEARRAVNAYEMLENGHYLVPHYNGQPDMWGTKPSSLVSLQALSMSVLGVNRIALRLPAFFFTLMLYLLILRFTTKTGKIEWGWITLMILATSQGFINTHGARSGDYEAMLTFFITTLLFYFYLYLNASNPQVKTRYLAITTSALILACLTKGIAGLLILPGIFLYTLLARNLTHVLRDWRLWIGVIVFLFCVGGYYLTRESINPGYLVAVWENELGGRYNEVLEQHQAPFYYYVALLFKNFFMPWILVLPLLIKVWKDKPKLFSYLLLTTLSFLLIISISATKLRWYLHPILPLLALLAAACLQALQQLFSSYIPIKRAAFFYIPLFIIPYFLNFSRIERRNEKDLEAGHIAYGLFIDEHLADIDTLYIPVEGYNPHTLFQTQRLKSLGKLAERIPLDSLAAANGGKVLICEEDLLLKLPEYNILMQTDYCWMVKLK